MNALTLIGIESFRYLVALAHTNLQKWQEKQFAPLFCLASKLILRDKKNLQNTC